ncbi:LysM peptidoglycan-binding domain-containing protein [Pseudovibrio sp. WM33]|uniref:LysM peptidoglycan-binding domain-containing protein n=1 Tax=Pseudovibrio sp. WM33 TaxID=1735585 RepID=UPI0007AE44C0|nr:LysM peptidoglycan-binding domain-containing protein [Pseudovibrio sp. WM33]KZL27791.1 LysM domain protein [Pseudovibrio sp. WM33]
MNEHSPIEPLERVATPDEESLSSELANLVQMFASAAQDLNATLSNHILGRLTDLLRGKKLRYFLSQDQRSGSAANTINLLKRMISFGFQVDVDLIYDSGQKTILQELAQLLPGFDPTTRASMTLDGVTITFHAYQESTVGEITHRSVPGLSGTMPLCLCGGGNIPNIDNTSIATAVKCSYFVLLQPYLWTAETCTQAGEACSANSLVVLPGLKQTINLDDQLVLQGSQFAYRSFKHDLTTKLNWADLRKTPEVNTKALSAAQNISNALGKSGQSGIEFFPVASLPGSSIDKTSLVGNAEGIAFELIAAAALLQKQKGFTKKPVVIAVLDDLSNSTWQTLARYFPQKNAVKQGTSTSRDELTKNINAYCKNQQVFRNTSGSGTGIYLNKDLSGSAGAAFLSKLKPGATVVTTLSDLPPDAIDYLYGAATLPSVLEGTQSANLAVNLGKPFFKLGNFTSNPYPSTFGNGKGKAASSTTPTTATLLDTSKNQIALGTSAFQEGYKATMPPNELAQTISDMVTQFRSEKGEYFEYFDGLKQYYTAPQNDKLLQALGFLAARFALVSVASGVSDSIFSDLQTLQTSLTENTKNGMLALIPNVLKEGPFHTFLQTVLGSGGLTIGSAKSPVTIKPVYTSKKLSKIIVQGKTSDFLGTELEVTLTVSSTGRASKNQRNYKVQLQLSLEKLELPGVEWFALEDTGLSVEFSSNGARLTGGVQTSIEVGDTLIPFNMDFPSSAKNKMVVQGAFAEEAAPSLNSLFALIGGMNFANSIPSEFADLNELSVDGLRFNYDSKNKRIESFQVSLKDSKEWDLFGGLNLKNLSFEITASQPTGKRQISWVASTDAMIASSSNQAILDLSATYPQTTVTATLSPDGANLPVSGFVNALLPSGYHLDVDADIANLSLEYSPGQNKNSSTYSVEAGVNLKGWQITWPPAKFELNDIYIQVKGVGTNSVGSIKASTTLFDGLPNVQPVPVNVTATFNTQNHLWTFRGEQGDTSIKISQIISAYLGSGWATSALDIDVSGLNVTFSTGTGTSAACYEFGGTVDLKNNGPDWLPSDATFTAKIGDTGGRELLLPGSKACIPVLDDHDEVIFITPERSLVRYETAKANGKYALLTADILWENIELTVFYEYAKTHSHFGITWGQFSAEVDDDQTATIKFTDTTTLGAMVETFVEWMTGAKFGLAAPFDLLNDVKLSDFELKWNFKTGSVEFDVKIGPIDLLIASVTGISLIYQKGAGVFVQLEGDFLWLPHTGLETTKLPPWRADQPSTTPSPGGAGNKYLDLRLLAGGQHVDVKGLQDVTTVQQAVDILADLHKPSVGQVPDIGFAGDINWLFATDFGVLRIDSSKELGQEHQGELEKSGPKYTFTLQVVLTDPSLYALRIACSGKAAKIFSGLDFQVIYKKVSPGLGKFSASIELPEIMRRIDVGAVTITLPTFGIEVYTNGDFQIDVGFPWNNNFSHSFSVEAIVPPGIPVKGGGGFYFGKLPAASVKGLPTSKLGFFNPNLVFGFGAQLGLGKSIEMGILKAGFSLTAFGILQGILAKWNAYDDTHSGSGSALSLQGEYFFSLTGTFGIIGKLYGSIDFAIIKASVNIRIEVSAQIQFASYEPIPLTISAKVDVRASAKIDLGLFTIKVSFSFSAHVHTTFTLGAIQNPKDAPWLDHSEAYEGLLAAPIADRLTLYSRLPMLTGAYETVPVEFNWANLQPAADPSQNPLDIHLGYGLTLAKDENWSSSEQARPPQLPCYVANLFITAPAPATPEDTELYEKAAGQQADTGFEALAKMVTRWLIAATMGDEGHSADQIDKNMISAVEINAILDSLSGLETSPDAPTQQDITSFLQQQFMLDIGLPSRQGEAQATYFPMVPSLSIALEQGSKTALSYAFADYNTITTKYLKDLTDYFNQLSVQVEKESKKPSSEVDSSGDEMSIASYIYENYFMLIMKQMMQSLLSGLRDFNYPLTAGEAPNAIVSWINKQGAFSGADFTLTDLFKANNSHPLTEGADVTIPTAPLVIPAGSSFQTLSSNNPYKAIVEASDLMCKNKKVAGLLRSGAQIDYTASDGTEKKHIISGGQTLCAVASALGITIDELTNSDTIQQQENLLVVGSTLLMPAFTQKAADADTLSSIAQKFETDVEALAIDANGEVADLFAGASGSNAGSDAGGLSIVHLPQFPVGELIKEVQRTGGITHLSGMASRYYFHGMRLPTDGITPLVEGIWVEKDEAGKLSLPNEAGLFALSGQQLAIPTPLTSSLSLLLSKPKDADWITLGNDQTTLKYDVDVPSDSEATASKDYQRIEAVTAYGKTEYLSAGPEELSLLAKVEQQPSAFPIPHFINWQSAEPINVPTHDPQKPSNTQYLRLWTLSAALTTLGANSAQNSAVVPPQLLVEQVSMDAATGKAIKAPLTNYGWASTIEFSIKKLPVQTSSAPAAEAKAAPDAALKTTYELNGVSSAGVVILERLLQSLPEDHSFASLTLGYSKGSQSSGTHFVGEGGSNVTFGLSQTNLSTVINPTGELLSEAAKESQSPTLLNTPMSLVKLLWEAGVTNSGGFYLYYTADDGQTGLPPDIFNEKGEATLSLVIIHEDQEYMHAYINGLATAQPIAGSGTSLTAAAKGELVEHMTTDDDTLASIALRYHSNLNSLIANTLASGQETSANGKIQLIPGKTISIEQGTYRVPQSGDVSFASIALRFGTSVEALKQVNPRLTGETVPAGAPIRLPVIELTIGSKTLSNDLSSCTCLSDIADYFGTEPIVVASTNAEMEQLLVTGQILTVRAGPLTVQPGEHPGVQAINAQREQAPEIPKGGTGDDYATALLLNNYSLLAYKILGNQDFKPSNMGLPIGASGKSTSPNEGKIRYVLEASAGDAEMYHGVISYLSLVKPENASEGTALNPYSANGLLLQTQLSWNDYYGNTILTVLDEPTKPAGKLNSKPALQGYTDQIIPLSQWPSTSANWTVQPEGSAETTPENFTILITFSFDSGPFILQKGQNPEIAQQRAHSALVIVEDMLAQFNDPNGFAIEVNSTLSLNTYQLSAHELEQLVGWWQDIEQFLIKQSNPEETDTSETIPPLSLPVTVSMSSLNQEPIIEITTQLVFKRTHGIAVGDYAADPLTRSVANTIAIRTSVSAPKSKKGGANSEKPTKPKPDILAEFAQCVAQSIYGPDFMMMVASGINRYAPSAGVSSNATWGVRVGTEQGDPISFHISDESQPEIYAPLPVNNTLISRSASVYPYAGLDDFDASTGKFTSTPIQSTFSNVEMDVWLKQYFEFFDALLSPKYSSSILFIDKLAANKPQSVSCAGESPAVVSGFMEALTEQKKSLAQITARMLAPIYQDGTSTRLASAQETFKQTLLEELSNLYTTQAVLSFGADITANIPLTGDEETPQLYGNINLNSVADCPPDAQEDAQEPKPAKSLSSLFSLTSAKLKLQDGAEQPLTFLLQASEKLGETTECLALDLSYKVTSLEHQISPVQGIVDYKASSWLSPIQAEGTPVLEKPLGSFKVPILLRSFPETPRMVSQAGPAYDTKAKKLSQITKWNYEYTYGLNFHYLQDKAHGQIQFNLKDKPQGELTGFMDAFAELVQFITIQNNLTTTLDQFAPIINAGNQSADAIEKAAQALAVIIKVNEDIICKANASSSFAMLAATSQKEGSETVSFSILEENQDYSTPTEQTSQRWIVKLILEDCTKPAGLTGDPVVEIPDWTSHQDNCECVDGKQTYTYYYTQKTKSKQTYLTQDIAQPLSDRQVVMPGMQVLARQDALASMYMIRNSYIHGKITDGFVFRTPTATFKNPFHPTLSSFQPLNIAYLGNPTNEPYQRSLKEHLEHLFYMLFHGEYAGDITLQLNIGYSYHLAQGLTEEPIDLPIALLPPTPVTIQNNGEPKGDILENLANSITAWAQAHKPSCNAAQLNIAMNIMSNLTENPMPLLNLQNLYLCTDDIIPPLPSYESETEGV